jgi:hypothetical protein
VAATTPALSGDGEAGGDCLVEHQSPAEPHQGFLSDSTGLQAAAEDLMERLQHRPLPDAHDGDNRIRLFLFDIKDRILGPYLVAIDRILTLVMIDALLLMETF